MARELINRIQNIRKASDFQITDKVNVELSATDTVKGALKEFGNYIAGQVLADTIEAVETVTGDNVTELDIDGEEILAKVTRK